MFIKSTDDKNIKYSSSEIVLYILSMLYHNNLDEKSDDHIATDVFRQQLVDSGVVLSWPEAPSLDDVEHYKNFDSKSENLLEDQYFKLPTIPSPESSELASIFVKEVTYDKDKNTFKAGKAVFDSRKNLNLFYLLLYFLKENTP